MTQAVQIGAAGAAHETIHVGRQAIYDRALDSRAYELFHCDAADATGAAIGSDGDRAACSVLLSAFIDLGLDRVSRGKRVFLSVAHDVICGALPLPVDPEQVVLQVRDFEHSPSELLPALKQRRSEGYRIAFDGFELCRETAALCDVADYVKLDFSRLGTERFGEQTRCLRRRGLQLVATRVQTQEVFRSCVKAGCDLYQGRFLFRPQVLTHKRVPKSLATLTRLLRVLRDPEVDFSEIEAIVKTDPALGMAVLKFLRSGQFGLSRPVTSVAQAVSLLGLREFGKWVTVVALTATTRRPSELCLVALTRARAAEIVAQDTGAVDPEEAFTVGLVSALDALFEQPLQGLLEELPLSESVRRAALDFSGPAGSILSAVASRDDESGRVGEFDAGLINRAWVEAIAWAEQAQRGSI